MYPRLPYYIRRDKSSERYVNKRFSLVRAALEELVP